MNKEKLFDLYEKSYFYEMEVREKLVGRVQINFALVVMGYAVISYMLRMLDFEQNLGLVYFFIFLVVACVSLSIGCVKHLVKAFWGNEYEGIPTGKEIDEYREKLFVYKNEIEKYNKDYPDAKRPEVQVDEQVKDFIYQEFRDCSSHNTEINDVRSTHIHASFKWLLSSSIPFFIASIVFIVGNLDVSSPRKETPIYNKSLTEQVIRINSVLEKINNSIKENNMSNHKTPPPPPSPPSQPPSRKVIQNDNPERKM